MQYTCFINGEACDMMQGRTPEFSRQANDIAVLADVKADNVIGLDLPDTGRNRVLTQYSALPANNSGFERNYFRVDVYYGGVPLIDNGLGYILEVSDRVIRLNVGSGNASIFTLLEDLTLQDLRFPELDHNYDLATVSANLYNVYTDGFIYPLIDYGRTTGLTVYDKVVRMYPDDDQNIFPAMFESYVFAAIFEAQGYTVAGDVLESGLFTKAIIPYVNEFFRNGARYAEENTISFTGGALAGSYGITGDTTFVVDDSQFFIVPGSATIAAGNATILFELSGDIVANEVVLSGTGVVYNVSLAMVLNGVLVTTAYVTTSPGDVLELAVEVTLTSLPATPVNSSNILFTLTNGSYVSTEFSNVILYGNEVQIEAQLPPLSQIEYVKSVLNRFGWIVQTDAQAKVCTFYSMEEVIARKYGSYDWTDKLSGTESRKQTRYERYGRTNIFAYSDDDTAQLPLFVGGTAYPYGSATFALSDNTLDATAEILTVPFAGTFDIEPTGVLNEWIAQIQHWVETDTPGVYEAQEVEPRCLYLNYKSGINISIDAGIYGTNVEPNAAIANFYIPSAPLNQHFISLLQTQYPKLIAEVLSSAVRLEAWMLLKAVDVYGFDHRKPVYLDQFGAYFYVNQIQSFIGDNHLTKVFLSRV